MQHTYFNNDYSVYLIRHGQSVANIDEKLHLDSPDCGFPLSEIGRAQTAAAAEAFVKHTENDCEHKYSASYLVLNSPFARTRETRDIFLSHPFFKDRIDNILELDALVEQDYGKFNGMTEEEIWAKYPDEAHTYYKAYNSGGKHWARFPMGESRADVAARQSRVIDFIKRVNDTGFENFLIFGHGTALRCLNKEWFLRSPEWLNEEPNPGNVAIRMIRNDVDYGYVFNGFKKGHGHSFHDDGDLMHPDNFVDYGPLKMR